VRKWNAAELSHRELYDQNTPLRAMEPPHTSPADSATLDAIQLMLRDLHTRHEEIRHKAAFRGCTRELLSLQQELVSYLLQKKSDLMGQQPNGSPTHNYNSFI
jgi:hypothetical protein